MGNARTNGKSHAPALPSATFDTVTANKFVVPWAGSDTPAILMEATEDIPRIVLYDRAGSKRFEVTFVSDRMEPSLALFAPDRTVLGMFGVGDDGPFLSLESPDEARTIYMHFDNGTPQLAFLDRSVPRLTLGLYRVDDVEEGETGKHSTCWPPALHMNTATGEPKFELCVDPQLGEAQAVVYHHGIEDELFPTEHALLSRHVAAEVAAGVAVPQPLLERALRRVERA